MAADRPRALERLLDALDVGDHRAEIEHEVGVLDAAPDRERAVRAHVDAHVQRVVHRDGALREHRHQDRRAEALAERQHLALRLEAEGLDADQHHRPLRAVEALDRVARRLAHLVRIRVPEVERPPVLGDGARHLDRPVHHVAVDLDVARPLLAPHRAHDRIDLLGGGPGSVDEARAAVTSR